MGLRLDDRWVWDFWHVCAGGEHHLFYLQAPRTPGDPEQRHRNSTIGHAVSPDLAGWRVLPDALGPGEAGSWDDYSVWTGSVIEHDSVWHLFYTGTSRAERGLVQRIGLATSTDLVAWRRHGPPVIEADRRWYELLDLAAWHDQAWRDPWVVRDADDGFHSYITARVPTGDPAGRGVIGKARSRDLREWEVLPAVTTPIGFGQLEVPQLVETSARAHLLFCGVSPHSGLTGTFALSAPTRRGPFDAASLRVIDADAQGTSYAGKVIETEAGLRFLAWTMHDEHGAFVGEIGDPRPVTFTREGDLTVHPPAVEQREAVA